ALLLDQLVAAVIPDLHGARAVLALGDDAREGRVLHRVVLGVNGQIALARLQRQPFRQRPAGQGVVHLQAQVVVQPAGVVALDDEDRPFAAAPRALVSGRLRRLAGASLAPVVVEGHQSYRAMPTWVALA